MEEGWWVKSRQTCTVRSSQRKPSQSVRALKHTYGTRTRTGTWTLTELSSGSLSGCLDADMTMAEMRAPQNRSPNTWMTPLFLFSGKKRRCGSHLYLGQRFWAVRYFLKGSELDAPRSRTSTDVSSVTAYCQFVFQALHTSHWPPEKCCVITSSMTFTWDIFSIMSSCLICNNIL